MYSCNHTECYTENNCIISDAQNMTTIRPNIFLTGIQRLLFTRKGRSRFPQRKSPATVNCKLHIHYLYVHR